MKRHTEGGERSVIPPVPIPTTRTENTHIAVAVDGDGGGGPKDDGHSQGIGAL